MEDGEGISERTFMHSPKTAILGLPWGGERVGLGEGGEGEKSGNNYNSLNNNKIFFKKLGRPYGINVLVS